MTNKTRRNIIKSLAAASLISGPVLSGCASQTKAQRDSSNWQLAKEIRNRIKLPLIPKRDFLITDFGAKSDGEFDCSQAIKDTIDTASKAGGGRVIVPAGTFSTGPVHLDSHIELHLREGATLSFIPDPDKYLPAVFTRWEGVEFMGLSPLIYAYGKSNIAITGKGTLFGGADDEHWWPYKGLKKHASNQTQAPARSRLFNDAEAGIPARDRHYAKEAYLRPPFIQLYKCENLLIEDITITASPFWLINPVLSNSITVRGVTCHSYGPNNDGCNPESCNDVLIEGCLFDTGDDCIAIKSGRNADGRLINVPSQNIVVANCNMKAGHGGVVMGSELSGGIRNVFVENCRMSSPDLWSSIRIKTNAMRGGVVNNVNVRNIDIGTVRDMVLINFYYEEGENGAFVPTVSGLNFENLRCLNAKRILNIRGFKHSPIKDISLTNITITQAEKASIADNVMDIEFNNVRVDGINVRQLSDLRLEAGA